MYETILFMIFKNLSYFSRFISRLKNHDYNVTFKFRACADISLSGTGSINPTLPPVTTPPTISSTSPTASPATTVGGATTTQGGGWGGVTTTATTGPIAGDFLLLFCLFFLLYL